MGLFLYIGSLPIKTNGNIDIVDGVLLLLHHQFYLTDVRTLSSLTFYTNLCFELTHVRLLSPILFYTIFSF